MIECLDSIQAQTYSNFSAIMIDDCSTDNSAQIAEQYAKIDGRFILIQKPQNEGIGAVRNTGLDYIFHILQPKSSDYIGFVDSDDVVAVDYFTNLIYCLESHKKRGIMAAKSYNPYRFKHESYNKKIFAYRARKSKGRITTKCHKIAQWLTLYRAPFVEHLRFPNARSLGEDIVFGNIANALAGKIAYTRTARYFYRQRQGSLVKLWNYSHNENFANFKYMLGEFVRLKLLESHTIKIDLVQDLPDEFFAKLQNLVRGYNFNERVLARNPNLCIIAESSSFAEFRAKIKIPLKNRIRHYFRIDIRPYKIYIKLFGKVLCDKLWR